MCLRNCDDPKPLGGASNEGTSTGAFVPQDKDNSPPEQNKPQSAGPSADAPQRTTLADIVRGATSHPPACVAAADVNHVPVKTGYAAAAARALTAGAQSVDAVRTETVVSMLLVLMTCQLAPLQARGAIHLSFS